MSEAISTPAAPVSTPSAPAASAAPASAPATTSAPVSTPVAAPVTTPEAAPVVAAPVDTSVSDAGKSTLQVMQEAQARKDAEAAAAPAEAVASEEAIPPVVEAPEKTPEQIAEEAAAVAAVEEADKPKADKDDDLPNFDEFELDPIALAPKELASKIETDAALAAALEANPELKNEIFGNARLAAETALFKEIVGTPEEARIAVEGHASFMGISTAMGSVNEKDLGTLKPVMAAMLEASAIRDADGNLQFHPNGALVTNGTVGKFLRSSFEQKLTLLANDFKTANDEEGQAAIDILMERAGLRTPSSPNEEEMSAEMRTQHDAIKAERAELDREKQERATEVATTYNTTVNTWIDNMMDAGISSILSRSTGLNDFSKKTVEANIRADLVKQIKGNHLFQDDIDKLDNLPYGAERQKKHKVLATRYFQAGLNRVVTARLAEAGAALTVKQQAQADKSAAREEAAKSETRGALPVPKTAPTLSAHDQFAKVESDLRTTLGRSPSTQEILAENLRRKATAA